MLRTLTLAFSCLCLCLVASGQEIQKNLKHFSRIVASPRINVVLEKGTQESIRLVYDGVREEKINIAITGRTLRLYLDKARKVERMKPESKYHERRQSMYAGAKVTAYITYRKLDALEIRGDQELTCKDEIESEEFTLRAYGENDITLASLRTGFFKAKLYGNNSLYVGSGRTLEQKYLLYGENKIDSNGLRSDYIITSIFGEGSLTINSTEEVRIDAFGEPQIYVAGGAHINRRLVIGKASIFTN